MNQISPIDNPNSFDSPALMPQKELEIHPHSHQPTLNEIQLRACRIHYEQGGVCGGYTLDDWLEAEHQLDGVDQPSGKKDHVH
jgi:hypothetical protein